MKRFLTPFAASALTLSALGCSNDSSSPTPSQPEEPGAQATAMAGSGDASVGEASAGDNAAASPAGSAEGATGATPVAESGDGGLPGQDGSLNNGANSGGASSSGDVSVAVSPALDAGAAAGSALISSPAALEPERTNLVKIDGAYLLVSSYGFYVVEEETGVRHELNPEDTDTLLTSVSPDGRTVVWSGLEPSIGDTLHIAYLLEDGFIAARKVTGYESHDGPVILRDWMNNGRFVVGARDGRDSEALVVVDIASGARWGEVLVNKLGSYSAKFSHDSLIAYTHINKAGDTVSSIVEVTESGLSEPRNMPAGARGLRIRDDGALFFFIREPNVGVFVQAPNQEPAQLATPPGLSPVAAFGPFTHDPSILMRFIGEGDQETLYRVFVDGSPPQQINTTGTFSPRPVPSKDGNWLLLSSHDDTLAHIDLMRQDEPLPTLLSSFPHWEAYPPISTNEGAIGDHFYFGAREGEMTLLSLQGDSPVTVTIPGSITRETGFCNGEFEAGKGYAKITERSLILLDTSAPEAKVLARIDAASDVAELSCPLWSAKYRSLAWDEVGSESSRVLQVDWDASGPSAPRVVLESEDPLSLLSAP